MTQSSELVFLKLGGSLITDKRQAETPRPQVIDRLATEIRDARRARPRLQLVIGHGSGSFGHVVGRRYGTREGVTTAEGWYGFAVTADAAARLNRLVVAALLQAAIPAWSIQPSVALRGVDGALVDGPHATVESALSRGLVPVVFGDVVLDSVRGGSIASTEEIFEWLAPQLRPQRIILAGEVDGIFTADPQLEQNVEPIPVISSSTLEDVLAGLSSSYGVDVTGGMRAKVTQALAMVDAVPGLEVRVCSGLIPGRVGALLTDAAAVSGTLLCG